MSDVVEITESMEKELAAMGPGDPKKDVEITESVTKDGDVA